MSVFVERTDDEIVQKILDVGQKDFFGVMTSDLLQCLSFERAKSFLKDGITADAWVGMMERKDRESILLRMHSYMSFAWTKANDGRGLSAMRSLQHYTVWIWLLGDDMGDLTTYQYYGKDELTRICQKYGWDAAQWDDGIRTNDE